MKEKKITCMKEERSVRCARQFEIYTFRCGSFVSLCCCTKISVGCLKLLTPADRRLKVMRRNFKWKILKMNKLLKHGFVFHFISISLTISIFLFFFFSLFPSVWFRWNRTFLQPSFSFYGLSSFYRFQTSSSLFTMSCEFRCVCTLYTICVFNCSYACVHQNAMFSMHFSRWLRIMVFKLNGLSVRFCSSKLLISCESSLYSKAFYI